MPGVLEKWGHFKLSFNLPFLQKKRKLLPDIETEFGNIKWKIYPLLLLISNQIFN